MLQLTLGMGMGLGLGLGMELAFLLLGQALATTSGVITQIPTAPDLIAHLKPFSCPLLWSCNPPNWDCDTHPLTSCCELSRTEPLRPLHSTRSQLLYRL